MAPAIGLLVGALDRAGIDLAGLGLAWARVTPSVTLVPALGLRALPGPARALMGLAMAAAVLPATGPLHAGEGAGREPWPVLALVELARGLPVAVAAAVPLWAATMAGGLADTLRGSSESLPAPTVEGRTTPLGALLSLLACAMFLAGGGPARTALALALHPVGPDPVRAAAADLVGGIELAVALGAPLLAAAVVIEIGAALVARAASPAQVHGILAPARSLAMLAVAGLVLDRLAAPLARAVGAVP
jgi:type III secretory pathway component EscT